MVAMTRENNAGDANVDAWVVEKRSTARIYILALENIGRDAPEAKMQPLQKREKSVKTSREHVKASTVLHHVIADTWVRLEEPVRKSNEDASESNRTG